MLLTKKIEIIANNSYNCFLLKKLGYEYKKGESILIPIEKLTPNSHKNVKVKCYNCGNIKEIRYQSYNKTTNNGKENYYCNNKECINKKRNLSNKEKYGVDNVFKLKNIREKIEKTNIRLYGFKNPHQNKEVIKKAEKTNLKLYGTKNLFNSEKIKERIKKTNLKLYGVEYPQQSPYIRSKYSSFHKSSDLEKDLFNYIESIYNGKIIKKSKSIIEGFELDIYIPELKIAFDFNDLYCNSELYLNKNYHLNKTEKCEKQNIQLIHIWEDHWKFKNSIIKSMILNKLKNNNRKIFARKCKIEEIKDTRIVTKFLNDNHIQGSVGSSIKLGLYYNDELVSLMNFGKKRKNMNSKNIKNEFELLRFCNKLNTSVIGGASKLFKYFIRNYKFIKITTYADRSYSKGELYNKLGFKFIHKTQPNYYYIINNKREYRFKYRKDILIKNGYDKNKSEHQIMLERNIYRIYNSGNLKYEYVKY